MKIWIFTLFCIILINCSGEKLKNIYQSIPKEINGWRSVEKDETYDREGLYLYINGGAELYLNYSFKQVFARKYTKEKNPDIILDIYEFNTSEDAYGIFSIERQDEEIGIGQGSEYGGGMLRFWKDKYFISIISVGNEQASKITVFELAKKVANDIISGGKEPAVINFLPKEGIQKNKTKFFHSHMILNRQYFVSDENILKLSDKTNCVFSKYTVDNNTGNLLVVNYENEDQAKSSYENFLKVYLPDANKTNCAQLENKKWTMVKLNKCYVMIVFDAIDNGWCEKLLSRININ